MADGRAMSLDATQPFSTAEENARLQAELAAATSKLHVATSQLSAALSERDQLAKLLSLRMLELERLRRQLFAQKAEKVDPNQLKLAFAEVAKLLDALEKEAGALEVEKAEEDGPAQGSEHTGNAQASGGSDEGRPSGKPKPKGRRNLESVDMPTQDVVIPADEVPEGAIRIEPEVSYKLERVRGGVIRLRILRERYVVPQDLESAAETGSATTILTAEMPPTIIPKGLFGPGMLAHVVTSKFADKLPYNRQEDILARDGIDIERSLMCRMQARAHEMAQRVVAAMRQESIAHATVIATDATGVLVQHEGACRRGHFWVAIADRDHVFFHYSPKHTSATPQALFAGFEGYLQADACSVYDALFRREDGPEEVGCWSHARRNFYWSVRSAKAEALIALGFIQRLFELDARLSKLPPSQRSAERRARAGPLLRQFFQWRDERLAEGRLDARSPILRALRYLVRHETALTRFLDEGRLPLENNRSERELRNLVVGRKNWLFVGHDEGAESACTFVSLIASCRLHGLNPEAYLRDLFRVLPHWPAPRVLELAPKYFARTRERLRREELELPLGLLTVPPSLPAAEQPAEKLDAA